MRELFGMREALSRALVRFENRFASGATNFVLTASLATGIACATASSPAVDTIPDPHPSPIAVASLPGDQWQVTTREHIDLWLHGFALLQEDSALVPLFRRGYKQTMTDARTKASLVSLLDANHDKLAAPLRTNRNMLNAQFVPMYFANWNDLEQTVNAFLKAQGNPRSASTREAANAIAILGRYFPTAPDRDWLRLFMQALNDESTKFYHNYWTQEQGRRQTTVTAFETLWRDTYQKKFMGVLRNSRRERGFLILSLPLDGEGRTLEGNGNEASLAITFPDSAVQGMYVLAHETIASIVSTAITDNITPNEARDGVADKYSSTATVRGGAILLERIAPELVDGYMRYYLASANRTVGTDLKQSFESTFPIPEGIRSGIGKQLDLILGGI